MRSLVTTFAFLLPFHRLKVRILNRVGHDIHPSVLIGMCLVRNVERFELAEDVKIGHFNVFGGLDLVKMGRGSRIIYFNLFFCGFTLEPGAERGSEYRTLRMGDNAHIVTMHVVDCSGGLVMGDNCWITGIRSTVLSHAFNPDGGILLEPVEIKSGAIVATSCTLLPGSVVGEAALVAAGSSVWTQQQLSPRHLHGGVPARRLSPVEIDPSLYDS